MFSQYRTRIAARQPAIDQRRMEPDFCGEGLAGGDRGDGQDCWLRSINRRIAIETCCPGMSCSNAASKSDATPINPMIRRICQRFIVSCTCFLAAQVFKPVALRVDYGAQALLRSACGGFLPSFETPLNAVTRFVF